MYVDNNNEAKNKNWTRITTAVRFENDGLYGLKDADENVILEAKYDHIELCTDFWYAHYDKRHKFIYKNGTVSDCPDRDDKHLFYENGMVGLKDAKGKVIIEPKYDEIYEWEENSDVI